MISLESLKKYEFFNGMTDGQLQDFASVATEEIHEQGTQIYAVGEPAEKLYIVEKGRIVMTMESPMGPHRPPVQVNVDFLTGGEAMGWSSVLEPHIYTLGALCVEKTEVIAFDAGSLRKMMDEDHTLGYRVMQATAKIIQARLKHIRVLLVGERRLANLTEF